MNITTIPAPQSVAEVEQLVKRLYQPGPPSTIRQINNRLQALQLSSDGWKLADELLASPEQNVRFFAALTFTVKLNNDGHSLDEDAAKSVLDRLMFWLVQTIRSGDTGLVCKKLCSTLTTYFIRTPFPWRRPIYHLALSLNRGVAIPTVDLDSVSPVPIVALISSLPQQQLIPLLWFISTLAEDVGKVDSTTRTHARFHNQMEGEVKDANAILKWAFQQNDIPLRAEALRAFLSWINYAQPVWPRNPDALRYLRDLTDPAAVCFSSGDLLVDALDIFRDVLESYTSFFQTPHMATLSQIIHKEIRPLLQLELSKPVADDSKYLPLGQFVIAFGCANVQQVVEEPENALGSAEIVDLHFQILSIPGYPGDEDQLSISSIEFWNTYIEYVNDTLFSKAPYEPDPTWLPQAKFRLQQAFRLLWRKMLTPPVEIAQEWGDDEREGFKEFRLDTADLLLSIFVLLGGEMLHQLVQLFQQSLEERYWQAVEASLFCLNTLADNILEDPENEAELSKVFHSKLFKEVADFSQALPAQTRRTAIDILGSYGPYIERHAEFLPDTLRFLFASLEAAGGLANAAAKSISSLCSTCRQSLTTELPGFLTQYQRFLDSGTSDPYTKEKVIGAIAAIIQAKTPESAKVEPLMALLEQIEKDVETAKQYAAVGDEDMLELVGVTALECLASIGRGMQVPEDIPIDIYSDDAEKAARTNFWDTDPGRAVQERIVSCFSVLHVVGHYSAAIDAACNVLRAGYTETEPGPFVLPPSVTVSFVTQCAINTPQIESVLSTACMWITQNARQDAIKVYTEVETIYTTVAGFANLLRDSSKDPGISTGCIDVFTRLMPQYLSVLLNPHASSTVLFTLTALTGPDQLPKRSACEFWSRFLKIQTHSPSDSSSTEIPQRIDQVLSTYGPQLAQCLVHQIGGLAQRSELDFLCEPLKALMMKSGGAQVWVRSALVGEGFPGASVAVQERERFLRQLGGVRSDGRKFKELVRAFWAGCRGTVVSYG